MPSGLGCCTSGLRYYGPLNDNRYPCAEQVLVVLAGTHGIERYAGAVAQLAILSNGFHHLPKGVGVALVHSVNPWGSAYGRRVDRNNIDLNRNGEEAPPNPYYFIHGGLLHPALWGPEAEADLRAKMSKKEDMAALVAAAARGQSSHPNGLFYSGSEHCQSWLNLMDMIQRVCLWAKRAVVVDIHTGLESPTGNSVDFFASEREESDATAAIRHILDSYHVLFPMMRKSDGAYMPSGDILTGMRRVVQETGSACEVLAFAAEFPTGVPIAEALVRMAAENWVYHHPGVLPPEEETRITRNFFNLFAPQHDAQWVQQVRDCSLDVAARALRFLTTP